MSIRQLARTLWLSQIVLAGCSSDDNSANTDATGGPGADATADATGHADGDTSGTDSGGDCSAVNIITARASAEAPGEGRTTALIDRIVALAQKSVTRSSLDYPATLTHYASSSAAGVTALKAQIASQVALCPNQALVLVGYSQGGHVVLDVLGGGGGSTLGELTEPIAATLAERVVAVVTFGDPRHVVDQPYDLGTSEHDGLYPRTDAQLQVLSGMAAKIESFCDATDRFCDSGDSLTVHQTYLDRYQETAAAFVVSRLGN